MPTRRGNHTASARSKRPRAPRSLLLLLLAVLAGLISAYALAQSGTGQAQEPQTPVSAAGALEETPARIDVLGDSYVAGSDEGGKGLSNWTSLTGTRFYEDGNPVELNPVAQPGSGYITRGATGLVFGEAANQFLSPEADVVLVFGSRNDGRQSDAAMYEAARSLYMDLQTLAPKAEIIVVGPVWVDANVPSSISANNQAMARAAADAKVRYVDALAEGWFAGSDSTLIGTDGVHPTNAGHAYLADKIYPILAETVAGLAR